MGAQAQITIRFISTLDGLSQHEDIQQRYRVAAYPVRIKSVTASPIIC